MHPGLTLVHPVIGFQVDSVHSILEWMLSGHPPRENFARPSLAMRPRLMFLVSL